MTTTPETQVPKKCYLTHPNFPGRGGEAWSGDLVDYKEIELLRKCLTTSSKIMSRRRVSSSAQEQKSLRTAVKRARFLALLPYRGQ
jgi:ribosomal protein S18